MVEHTTSHASAVGLFKKLAHSSAALSPRSAWALMVLLFVLINGILVLSMGVFFFRVTQGSTSGGENISPVVPTIGREGMMESIAGFEVRRQNFELLKTSYQATPNPSR